MATESTTRRFNPAEFAKILALAAVAGVAIPYAYTRFHSDEQPKAPATAPRTPAAPPPPPKIDFLEAGTLAGTQSTFTKGDLHGTADLGPDDATIVWLKAELPARPGGGASGKGGSGKGGSTEPVAAPVGGGGGGGRGRRGGGLPLSVKDAQGEDYSYSIERKEGGLMALHLKKGYAKKPDSLTVTENQGDKVVGTWKIDTVPSPTLLLPDNALQGQPLGEILLKPGRRGRLGATVHLTTPMGKDEGAILTPVSASYTPIDTSRTPQTMIVKPGENPFDGPVNFPNPKMARRVSFDMQSYQGVTTTETVSFKSAHIDSVFGQPVLIVDKDEVVTTPSGLKLTLPSQNESPKRQPKRVHAVVAVRLVFDPASVKADSASGIAPGYGAELLTPTVADLGLQRIDASLSPSAALDGAAVFSGKPAAVVKGTAGTVKTGPVSLTFKVTIVRPKLGVKKRIVLPVNPKILPADPAANGPVGAVPKIG